MVSDVIIAVVSLVLGVATGLFFESRATKSAQRQNEQLRRDLETLRRMVYSLGGDPDREVGGEPVPDLLEAVRSRALATQDASGKVNQQELVVYFIRQGANAGEVEAAIADLCRAGTALKDGRWLTIK